MPTDQKTGRPVAGQADDATRKRMLAARMVEKEPKGLYAKKAGLSDVKEPGKVTVQKTVTLNPIKNLKQRKSRLDQAIEDSGG